MGVVLADRLEVFPFLKIKPLSLYYYIWLSGAHIYISIVFYYHSQSLPVGVVLVERQEVFPFRKIKPPPPLWLNRVKCSLFIHFHCFYHESQYLRTKIKFPVGVVLVEKLEVFLKIKPPFLCD